MEQHVMLSNSTASRNLLFFIVVAYGIVALYGLGDVEFWGDEGIVALGAKRVLHFGYPKAWDGVNLFSFEAGHDLDENLIQKRLPWLAFYIGAAGMFLFGENHFGARFGFAMCGIANLLLMDVVGRRLGLTSRRSLFAVLILASQASYFLYLRQSYHYVADVTLTLLGIWIYLSIEKRCFPLLLSLSMIALFHLNYLSPLWTALSLFLMVLWEGQWLSLLKRRSTWVGLGVGLVGTYGWMQWASVIEFQDEIGGWTTLLPHLDRLGFVLSELDMSYPLLFGFPLVGWFGFKSGFKTLICGVATDFCDSARRRGRPIPAAGLSCRDNAADRKKMSNPLGDSSFGRLQRWLRAYSPLRGCSLFAALDSAKIAHRATHHSFETTSSLRKKPSPLGEAGHLQRITRLSICFLGSFLFFAGHQYAWLRFYLFVFVVFAWLWASVLGGMFASRPRVSVVVIVALFLTVIPHQISHFCIGSWWRGFGKYTMQRIPHDRETPSLIAGLTSWMSPMWVEVPSELAAPPLTSLGEVVHYLQRTSKPGEQIVSLCDSEILQFNTALKTAYLIDPRQTTFSKVSHLPSYVTSYRDTDWLLLRNYWKRAYGMKEIAGIDQNEEILASLRESGAQLELVPLKVREKFPNQMPMLFGHLWAMDIGRPTMQLYRVHKGSLIR